MLVLVAVLVVAGLIACTRPGAPSKGAASAAPITVNNPAVAVSTLPPVSAPNAQTANITFLTGSDVEESNAADPWHPAQIGDALDAGSRIKVGAASSCEVQFGNEAVAHIDENSEVAVGTLLLAQNREVGLSLTAGGVISKVETLASGDSYTVATPTTVAGVRGTEFSVNAQSAGTTSIAVKEGVVTVIPPQATPGALSSGLQGAAKSTAESVAAAIAASAPKIEAGQQVEVGSDDFAQTVTQLKQVQQAIAQAPAASNVTTLAASVVSAAAAGVPKPVAISDRAQQALALTDTMQLLPTAPAAAAAPSGQAAPTGQAAPSGQTAPTGQAAPTPAAASVVPFSVTVSPANAEILLDGRSVGTRRFSALLTVGRKITVTARLSGYQQQVVPVTVPTAGVALSITLPPVPQTPSSPPPSPSAPPATQQPASANAPSPAPANAPSPTAASTAPAQTPTAPATATQPAPQSAAAAQAPPHGTIALQTNPPNADIYVNGNYVGTGSYTSDFPAGTNVTVRASLRGYADANLAVSVAANGSERQTLQLAARPIEGSYAIASAAFVREAASWNGAVIVADRKGTIRSVAADGSVNWSVTTQNPSNDNSKPFIAGGVVYFSGSRQFLGIDASSGKVLFTKTLSQSEADLFGRSVASGNGEIYYTTNSEIEVYQPGTATITRRLPLPSSSNMAAAFAEGKLIIADQQGTLYELDPQSGSSSISVSTDAIQPVAASPAVHSGRAFFVGRRGNAVLVDLASGKALWQRLLSSSAGSSGAYTDAIFTDSGIYVVVNNSLFALSPSDGKDLFAPIPNVSAPPFNDGNVLYYTTSDGRLVRADAQTGAPLSSLDIGGAASARPVRVGDDIAVATASGKIVLVYPSTM